MSKVCVGAQAQRIAGGSPGEGSRPCGMRAAIGSRGRFYTGHYTHVQYLAASTAFVLYTRQMQSRESSRAESREPG